MTWTALTDAEKREATRQAIVDQHMSYGEAAFALGTTRSAIAGVVNRSHKYGEPIPRMSRATKKAVRASARKAFGLYRRKPGKEKAVPKKAKPKHQGLQRYVPLLPDDAIDRTPSRNDVWHALPGSSPVPIDPKYHHDGCRWPIGDDLPFLFCNDATTGASVYCAVHSSLAYREPPPKKAT